MNRRFTSMLVSAIFLMAVAAMALPAESQSFDPVSYVIRETTRDGTPDTLGMISFQSEPKLGATTQIDVEWYLDFETKDSITIIARGGTACSFLWDRPQHTWYGDHQSGDVLSTSFTIQPIQVGMLAVTLQPVFGPGQFSQLSVGFVLDEHGDLIEGVSDIAYGRLGPLPKDVPSELYFVKNCYQTSRGRHSETICIRGKLSLPLMQDQPSTYECYLVPTCDFSQGVYYQVEYDDVFDVALPHAIDWPGYVRAGDSLRIELEVTPRSPGVGSIWVRAWGFNPMKEPPRPTSGEDGGHDADVLRAVLVIDEDYRVIASSTESLPDTSRVNLADSYRLAEVQRLMKPVTRSTLSSENFESTARSLYHQIRSE